MKLSGVSPSQTYRATVTIVAPEGHGTIEMPNRLVRFHMPGLLLVQMEGEGEQEPEQEDVEVYPFERVVSVTLLERSAMQRARASSVPKSR